MMSGYLNFFVVGPTIWRSFGRWLLFFGTGILSLQIHGAIECTQVFRTSPALVSQALKGNPEALKQNFREVAIAQEPGFSFTERFLISGDRARRVQTVNGFMNGGIFQLERAGSILKLYQEGMFSYGEFIDTVKGNLLSALAGGPQLIRFGELVSDRPIETASRAQENRIGERVFFIEFENISEVGSLTLKDARKLKHSIPSEVWESVAELLLKLIKHRIIPDDADFMISPSGMARWIDGDSWYRMENASFHHYLSVLKFNLALLPKSFDEVLLRHAKQSQLLSEQERAELLQSWP